MLVIYWKMEIEMFNALFLESLENTYATLITVTYCVLINNILIPLLKNLKMNYKINK